MKRLGIFGLGIGQPYGEAEVSTSCYALVTEELARGWMSLAGAMGGHTVVAKLIESYGTEEQKDRYLPEMTSGEIRSTMALTEPAGGSDLQAIRTTASRDGEDYLVNGSKTPGSPMPGREDSFAEIRAAYVAHLERMLELSGYAASAAGATDAAGRIMALETRLAAGHWDVVHSRDAVATYTLLDRTKLEAQAPQVDWAAWLSGLGPPDKALDEVVVR